MAKRRQKDTKKTAKRRPKDLGRWQRDGKKDPERYLKHNKKTRKDSKILSKLICYGIIIFPSSCFLFLFVGFTLFTNETYPNLLIKKAAKWIKKTSVSVFVLSKVFY